MGLVFACGITRLLSISSCNVSRCRRPNSKDQALLPVILRIIWRGPRQDTASGLGTTRLHKPSQAGRMPVCLSALPSGNHAVRLAVGIRGFSDSKMSFDRQRELFFAGVAVVNGVTSRYLQQADRTLLGVPVPG
jgi:hypothetical protein